MKTRNLALLTALILGFAPIASAQRHNSSFSIGHGSISVGATLGRVGIQLGFGSRPRYSHQGSSRYSSYSSYSSPRYCAPTRVWIEGHYRTDYQRVWIPARSEKRWVPPYFETRVDYCGRATQVLIRDGYWSSVAVPGYYENRPVKNWVSGRWEYRR